MTRCRDGRHHRPQDHDDDEPNLDSDHLVEIGKLAVLAASIEYHLAGIIALLVCPDEIEIGYMVVGRQQFKQLAVLATKILRERLTSTTKARDPEGWAAMTELVEGH